MPKLPRVTVVLFGATGPGTDFGQFGSKAAAAPQTEADYGSLSAFIAGCQALSAWVTGWASAAVGAAFNPYLEDMNGPFKVFSYYIANAFERGVPDWDAGTTYYKGALVQDPAGSGQEFFSLTDNNLNNSLPLGASNAQWRWQNPPVATVGVGASPTANTLPKISAVAAAGGFPGSTRLVDSNVSEDGSNIILGLPLKFPDGSTQGVGAAPISVQNVVTGSRVKANVYQNTTGKPMTITVICSNGPGEGLAAYTDVHINPITNVGSNANQTNTGQTTTLTFVVLAGNYYKVDGEGTISGWVEWY